MFCNLLEYVIYNFLLCIFGRRIGIQGDQCNSYDVDFFKLTAPYIIKFLIEFLAKFWSYFMIQLHMSKTQQISRYSCFSVDIFWNNCCTTKKCATKNNKWPVLVNCWKKISCIAAHCILLEVKCFLSLTSYMSQTKAPMAYYYVYRIFSSYFRISYMSYKCLYYVFWNILNLRE